MAGLSARISRHASESGYSSFNADDHLAAKKLLINTIGIALAGRRTEESRRSVDFVRMLSAPGSASILGETTGTRADLAAFANATAANAHDFDDNFDPPPSMRA
jgi:2-methylcitrate dehydratase PrpD